jgi:hypothetical protein
MVEVKIIVSDKPQTRFAQGSTQNLRRFLKMESFGWRLRYRIQPQLKIAITSASDVLSFAASSQYLVVIRRIIVGTLESVSPRADVMQAATARFLARSFVFARDDSNNAR